MCFGMLIRIGKHTVTLVYRDLCMRSAGIVFGVLLAHPRVLSRSDRNRHSKVSHVITAHSVDWLDYVLAWEEAKYDMINTTATRNSQNGACLSNDEHKHMHQLNPTQPNRVNPSLPTLTHQPYKQPDAVAHLLANKDRLQEFASTYLCFTGSLVF